jgi:hypothetical protein
MGPKVISIAIIGFWCNLGGWFQISEVSAIGGYLDDGKLNPVFKR